MNGFLTPQTVRLVSSYDDGDDARHFTFEPAQGGSASYAAPGQFFMLSVPGKGEAPFTYTRAPDGQGRFEAVVRRVGVLTHALLALAPGSLLGYRGPYGQGWPLHELTGLRVLVVSGGCGLAPLAGALSELAMRNAQLALIYGSRSASAQVLARERAQWRTRFPVLETLDEAGPGQLWVGTPLVAIDAAVKLLGGEPEAVLTCGSEVMMDSVARAMVARGVRADHVWLSLERRMHCGVGVCGHCYIGHTYACKDGPTYRWDELQALRSRAPDWPALLREVRHC